MVAYVGLGANLGDPVASLRSACCALGQLGLVLRRSGFYRTAPLGGPPGQPDYLNAVVALRPQRGLKDPRKLLEALLAVEQRHGRVRRIRWESRRLDLDLLGYGDLVLEEPGLVLPHPRMLERAFVLRPLCEVAPRWVHPIRGVTACEALKDLGAQRVDMTELDWGPC